jgi:thioredoxin-dependent peroxiredoxin
MRKRVLSLFAAAAIALPAHASLAPGGKAPDFTTQGALAGKTFTLSLHNALKKGPVVLYFFPAAFTPGCSAEARAFAEATADFKAAGATVIGMSADSIDKLKDFSTKDCASKFAVASATPAVIKGFDVALPTGSGRTMTNRTSYVIAPDGKILYVHSEMSPANHVRNTLQAVRDYQAQHHRG